MKVVGGYDLKTHLLKVLDAVAQDESVIIKRRG